MARNPKAEIRNSIKRNFEVRLFLLAVSLAVAVAHLRAADPAPAPKPTGIRRAYTITLLPDGRWLAAGGYARGNDPRNQSDYVTNEALIFIPTTGKWTNTGAMMSGRIGHAATLLSNGEVLVTGGEVCVLIPNGAHFDGVRTAEIYNPASGKWRFTGPMNQERSSHTATLLPDGKVLVAGGTTNSLVGLSTAELYDPKSEQWSNAASMKFVRAKHTATLLTNGLVLVAGGWNEQHNFRFDAELYDPIAGKWTTTGEMPVESRFFYSNTPLTNGLVLLTAWSGGYDWEVTNAWEVSKLLFNPANGRWTAIGPRRRHLVSSTNLDRTLTILPESGSQFLASQEIELLIESADRFGVTNIQLFQDAVRIAVGEDSPMRFTITNPSAGTYTFFARADFANGLASTSSPVSITFKESGLEVFLAPGPTEFISERYVKSSPAILRASVVGVNPDSLTSLTLNGSPQPLQTGNFVLRPPLTEGRNVFVLVAKDKHGRSADATTEIILNTSVPSIAIKEPADGASINAMCVDVRGTFTAKTLKRITVDQMPGVITGTSFEARSVFLQPGTNTIRAIAEDMAGNATTNAITIIGPTDTNIAQALPVQIRATPSGGFAPLTVAFTVEAHVPGAVQKVFYDFDGDGSYDQTNTDLKPVTHAFKTDGEYFPVVTIQTGVGRFSSIGAGFWFFQGTRVNVQKPPVLVSAIKITDPVDLKCTAASNLYVVSGTTATITEFDAAGRIIRSLKNIAGKPSGFDLDQSGSVYLALSASNQVWKFKPTPTSFEPDYAFGNGGFIGNKDGSSGSGTNALNRPFDVAVIRDLEGEVILVSDSGNHRIQRFTRDGKFSLRGGVMLNKEGGITSAFGELGTNRSQFKNPKGLAFGEWHLFIADSGNNRITVAHHEFGPEATSGGMGTDLGEFRAPAHLCAGERGICVADEGNDRIEIFDMVYGGEHGPLSPFNPRLAIGRELGLKRPSAVAWANDLLEDKIYVADTGNDRVLLIRFPADTPEAAWNSMKGRLLKGDIDGAITYFASHEAEKYRETYLAIGTNELAKTISEIPPIKPVEIKHDTAQYRFDQVIQGQLLTFPIEFVKENGKWKIMEY
jgi:hypothetical protein